jgi:DNA adenine methylase
MAPFVATLRVPTNAPAATGRPFLKWAGGKQWLAAAAADLVPAEFVGTYHEPFLGAGAMFFAVQPDKAILSDLNALLITTYLAIKADVERVIQTLSAYRYDADAYELLRKRRTRRDHTTAARLIYLNKTSFNGLYRVNRRGQFNVPMGSFQNPTICDPSRLRNAATALQHARLGARDFGRSTSLVRSGDFVYLDPPYITGHTNNGFVKYNANLFSWADQTRLSAAAARADHRGAFVVVSNAYHPSILKLYDGFKAYACRRRSAVGVVSSRGEVREVLLTNFDLPENMLED